MLLKHYIRNFDFENSHKFLLIPPTHNSIDNFGLIKLPDIHIKIILSISRKLTKR